MSGSVTRAGADALLAPAGKSLAGLASARAAGGVPIAVQVRLSVRLDREERRTANVIGILPGTDPARASEVVVLGAHYDHLGRTGGVVHPGADDNASGTAVVLGMARALAAAGGTARTLVVVFFSGEEIGLLGSAHYVKHPALPIERTVAMLNFDMVGRMRNDRLKVGGVESGGGLRALVERVTSGDRLDLVLHDSPYGPSDHASFYAAGVPVLFFHTGGHDDYHAPGDTADKINAAGMAEVARLGLRIAERLGGEARPAYVALARPVGSSREGSARGGDSGGAFLGVSVDGRSESDGVRLGSVIAGSGAERAGLRGGDVIVRMGDHGLSRFEDLRRCRRPASGRCGGARLAPRRGTGAHPRRPPLSRLGRARIVANAHAATGRVMRRGPGMGSLSPSALRDDDTAAKEWERLPVTGTESAVVRNPSGPAASPVRHACGPSRSAGGSRKNARMSAASASGSSSAAKWPPAGMGVQRVML